MTFETHDRISLYMAAFLMVACLTFCAPMMASLIGLAMPFNLAFTMLDAGCRLLVAALLFNVPLAYWIG